MYLAETGSEGVTMNCRHQDRDKWWGFRNTAMTFLVPQNAGNFLISPALFKFQESLCSMEWAGHYQTYIIPPLHYCGTAGGTMAKLQTERPSITGPFPEIYLIPKMSNQVRGPPSLLVNGHCMTCQLVPSSHEAHRSPLPGVQAKTAWKIPPLPKTHLHDMHTTKFTLLPLTHNMSNNILRIAQIYSIKSSQFDRRVKWSKWTISQTSK